MSIVVLLEATPRRPADGVAVPVRLMSNAAARADYFGVQWHPLLAEVPAFDTDLGFDGDSFGQGATPAIGEIGIALDPTSAPWAGLIWRGAALTLRTAPKPLDRSRDPADGDFTVIWRGRADTLREDGGLLRIVALDAGQSLRVAVQPVRFGSSGNALLDGAGAADHAGRVVPLGWGQLLSCPGLLVDPAFNIWLFLGRAATSLQGIEDGGVPFAAGVARASLAALRASVPAEGACDYCLDAGGLVLARPWTPPTYPLLADLTAGPTAPASIAASIVAARGGPAFTAGAVAAFDALVPGPAQLYIDDEAGVAAALDRLFPPLGAYWKLNAAGTIDLGRIGFAAPAMLFGAHRIASIARKGVVMPTRRRTIGYARANCGALGEGDIAKVLLLTIADITGLDAQLAAIGAVADDALATADGKINAFFEPSAPAAADERDLWFDTDDGNRPYRRAGGLWIESSDDRIGAAILAAAGAQGTADGKATTFITDLVTEPVPVAEAVGDLWWQKSTKTLRRWSGSEWIVYSAIGVADGATRNSDPNNQIRDADTLAFLATSNSALIYRWPDTVAAPSGASQRARFTAPGEAYFNGALATENLIPIVPGQPTFIAYTIGRGDGANGTAEYRVNVYDRNAEYIATLALDSVAVATLPNAAYTRRNATWNVPSVVAVAGSPGDLRAPVRCAPHVAWTGATVGELSVSAPYFGRFESGATVGASWNNNIAGQPANADIYNWQLRIIADAGTLRLQYFNGGAYVNLGATDLAGLGAGALAFINLLDAANIGTYMANATIGDALIANLNALKITAGQLQADRLLLDGFGLTIAGPAGSRYLVINDAGVTTTKLAGGTTGWGSVDVNDNTVSFSSTTVWATIQIIGLTPRQGFPVRGEFFLFADTSGSDTNAQFRVIRDDGTIVSPIGGGSWPVRIDEQGTVVPIRFRDIVDAGRATNWTLQGKKQGNGQVVTCKGRDAEIFENPRGAYENYTVTMASGDGPGGGTGGGGDIP